MTETLEYAVAAFTDMHNSYIADWNEAMISGDTSKLERMGVNYYVTFFGSAKDKPVFYSKDEAISGMKLSVEQLLGAQKKFENRVIRLRDNKNAVVFFELVIEKDGQALARLFTTEYWERVDNQWLLARETEQPIS